MASTYDWNEIPCDVVQEIARHVDFVEDCQVFSRVCSVWRCALKMLPKGHINNLMYRQCQPPLLMLAEPPATPHRSLYSLASGNVRKVHLPYYYNHDHARDRYFSSRGWIISLTEIADKITLFNPLLPPATAAARNSSVLIEAPTVADELISHASYHWEYDHREKSRIIFHKFILSSHLPTAKDFVAVILEIHHRVGFWRIGHDQWVKPITGPGESTVFDPGWCHDVCFHKGKFYTINHDTQVIAYTNDHDGINWHPKMVIDLTSRGLIRISNRLPIDSCYLVGEWEHDSILVVFRLVILPDDWKYFTKTFYVFEVNVETGQGRKVESLGNRAIYVGSNSTFFFEASNERGWDERGCRPNCIYFTDDNREYYGPNTHYGGGSDMGIYSMDENKVLDEFLYQGPCESCYSFSSPPMWIENSRSQNL